MLVVDMEGEDDHSQTWRDFHFPLNTKAPSDASSTCVQYIVVDDIQRIRKDKIIRKDKTRKDKIL